MHISIKLLISHSVSAFLLSISPPSPLLFQAFFFPHTAASLSVSACPQRQHIKSRPPWMEREHTAENISSMLSQLAPPFSFPQSASFIYLFFFPLCLSHTVSVSLKCSQCVLFNKKKSHTLSQPTRSCVLTIHKLQKCAKSSCETKSEGMCEGHAAPGWGGKKYEQNCIIGNQKHPNGSVFRDNEWAKIIKVLLFYFTIKNIFDSDSYEQKILWIILCLWSLGWDHAPPPTQAPVRASQPCQSLLICQ